MKSTIICIASVAYLSGVFAQDVDQLHKLQLAQSLEQAGEYERASVVYEELVRIDTANYVYFDALRRVYVQLKEYEKAIVLVEQRRSQRPGDVVLTTQLGGLYYDRGDTAKASTLWNAAINEQPKMRQMYALIAQQMQERRLYDKAIVMYTKGRAATGNPTDFVEELALLHSAMQDYSKAVEEYLRLLKGAPQQLGYIQSRIASFTIRQEGLAAARATVASAVERSPNDIPLRTLVAWLAMEQGDHTSALEQYRVIDRVARTNGGELYNFAQRCTREGANRIAAAAYREILDNFPTAPTRPYARLGYARAVEDLSVSDTAAKVTSSPGGEVAESHLTIGQAISLYEQIVLDYPGTDPAFQSLFRIGVVKFERLFDLDGALVAFTKVRGEPRAGAITMEAVMYSSDVEIAKNNLAAAKRILQSVPATPMPEVRDRIAFRLAQISYYELQFDSALALLGPLTMTIDRDLANDALSMQYFIAENKSNAPALEAYVKGELLVRQRKYSEGLAQFEEFLRAFAQSLLADDATLLTAEIRVIMGKPEIAVEVLRKLVTDNPTSIIRDRAQFRTAEICETILNDRPQALKEYEKFLAIFPSSLYTEEVRKRIRSLRGDIL